MGLPYSIVLLVEEADVEDAEGNVSKELYMLPVTSLESHAGYRLEAEDPDIFSDGGEDDKEGCVCPRVWPQVPIPMHRGQNPPSAELQPVWPQKLFVAAPTLS